MSPWPRNKVAQSVPFTYTGLDYFDPIYIQAESSKEKVWVCLYLRHCQSHPFGTGKGYEC